MVLRENLHGLELDARCVELAAFALALTAWRYPDAGGYRVLPELQVACSGLAISVAKEEWKELALGRKELRIAMDWLYDTFADAPVLGSLIDPAKSDAAKVVNWEDLGGALSKALQADQADDQRELGVVAQGLTKAAQLLSQKYGWVITNVPYLARGKQSDVLKKYCERYFSAGKNDLATVFLDRCLEFCREGGTTNVVLPQNWLFLGSYRKFREKLLRRDTWNLIARLGPKGFETPMWDFNVQLITLSRGGLEMGESGNGENGDLFFSARSAGQAPHLLRGLDVSAPRSAVQKAAALLTTEVKSVEQAKQLKNPDTRVAFDEVQGDLLEKYASAFIGQRSGDGPRFIYCSWELDVVREGWELFGTTVDSSTDYSGNTQVILWEDGAGKLSAYQAELARTQYASGGWKQGWQAWGVEGIRVSQMQALPVTIHCGPHFDNNSATIIPHSPSQLPAIWCFCSSPEYNEAVRRIDQKLNVTNSTLVKIPFDLEYWTKVAKEKYPHGLPKPYTDDPTQWIFHGHPCASVVWDEQTKETSHGSLRNDDTVLQVAVARLLGYRWPAELDFNMELADEQRDWVKRSEGLLSYADKDGIVCIPAVRGETSAADRLLNLLAAAYGDVWSNEIQAQLLKSADHAGKNLENWLREKFFAQHCKLFQHRPFIWHVWDGLRDGFAALVNYHKLNAKNLETLIYTYLGDWISRQKQDIANGVDGAAEKLAAAENLKKRLELIKDGEAPYDIFVRWKPLEEQPVGWNPDLNDGVRLNIRPFMTAEVLRENKPPKLNVKWTKDRGKDVESAPWYHLFNGERINDHHLTLEEKEAARQAVVQT